MGDRPACDGLEGRQPVAGGAELQQVGEGCALPFAELADGDRQAAAVGIVAKGPEPEAGQVRQLPVHRLRAEVEHDVRGELCKLAQLRFGQDRRGPERGRRARAISHRRDELHATDGEGQFQARTLPLGQRERVEPKRDAQFGPAVRAQPIGGALPLKTAAHLGGMNQSSLTSARLLRC
jgi:hypothetical protein